MYKGLIHIVLIHKTQTGSPAISLEQYGDVLYPQITKA
jgi:hypothetical protein